MRDDHMFDLTGKVAVVTGSSRGIGRAIAEALADHGARVVVSSRKPDACAEVVAAIEGHGGEAMAIPCNVSYKDQLQALVDKTIETWGHIDILVCNAAVNPYFGPLKDIGDDAYDKIMNTNVRSNLWLCNMVIPQMAERHEGAVIIVSSIAAFIGSGKLGAYGLSKAADLALARNLAVEWGHANVRVNCINPGIIRTDFARALWENPEIYDEAIRTYALKRIGEPQEIAGAAVFLASRAGSFMTGQAMVIDGGSTIYGGEV